jgi:hypothetical protein
VTVKRRTVMIGGAASLAAGSVAARPMTQDLGQLGYEALVYALPSYEMFATRARALAGGLAQNVFLHSRRLSTAKSRAVTAPNTDTLYSTAWLDLSEPVAIALPRVGSRYFSLALMDIYSNNFAVLGGAERAGVERVRLHFGEPAPTPEAGVRLIRSPTPMVWALGRTYTAGEADMPAARAVQDTLKILSPAKPAPASTPPPPRSNVAALLQYANLAMSANPPPARDATRLKRLARVGVGPDRTFPPAALAAGQVRQVVAGAQRALADLQHDEVKPYKGWLYAKPDTGDFGVDYMNRARIALTGLAALTVSEAFYLKGAGDHGDQIYDGKMDHSLVFPDGRLPPAEGFWSITLYQATPEGQLFLFDNPQDRYSIGSNTGALARAADGSVKILLSTHRPADPALASNWLPAPAGPYRLEFRAFRPGADLGAGRYRVPPVLSEARQQRGKS